MTEFLLQTLPNLGVGGLIAVVLLWFMRRDAQRTEERFVSLVQDFDERWEEALAGQRQDKQLLIGVIQENTRVVTQLSERLGHPEHGRGGR